MSKSPDAFRTISEVADWLDTPAHVLRFWESKFSHVKPVKRAGGRRYYRPNDMKLLGGIKRLLHQDGLTIKEVQLLLREKGAKHVGGLSTFDINDEDGSTSGPVIEIDAEETPSDEPVFTSVTPRAPLILNTGDENDPENQMSFPGFEFSSDRSKTFQSRENVEAANPKPVSIDISHIEPVNLQAIPETKSGNLTRLALLKRGSLASQKNKVDGVISKLADLASTRASSSNS
jgi:resuscitation-promoting factor RpfA